MCLETLCIRLVMFHHQIRSVFIPLLTLSASYKDRHLFPSSLDSVISWWCVNNQRSCSVNERTEPGEVLDETVLVYKALSPEFVWKDTWNTAKYLPRGSRSPSGIWTGNYLNRNWRDTTTTVRSTFLWHSAITLPYYRNILRNSESMHILLSQWNEILLRYTVAVVNMWVASQNWVNMLTWVGH